MSAPCSGEIANRLTSGKQPRRPSARFVAEARGDEAGMQAVGGDAASRQPARQFAGEQDVGELRAAIGLPAAIAALAHCKSSKSILAPKCAAEAVETIARWRRPDETMASAFVSTK